MPRNSPIFITATDTNVGKTIVTCVIGVLMQNKGVDIGAMKPVQCAGEDAQLLRKVLSLKDEMSLMNPFFAPEPLSPHIALKRAKIKFDPKKIKDALQELQNKHDQMLIEGAGGLMVPLTDHYYNADLIRELKAEIIIVARLGLGTINHTLLTVDQAKAYGLKIKGILFSDTNPKTKTFPERTNPQEIEKLTKIRVLGTIPFLGPTGTPWQEEKTITKENILKKCRKIDLNF